MAMPQIYVTGSEKDAFRIEEVAKIQEEQTNNKVRHKSVAYIDMKSHVSEIFNNIKWADVLLVVPGADGTLDADVLYEMEYASRECITIVVLDSEEEAAM